MEDEKKLCYKFVGMPTFLTLRLDNNLRIMLFTLIQLSSWAEDDAKKNGQEWDGWFFRDNARLQAETRLSKNLVIATIETLYRENIIDVRCLGKSKGKNQKANYYKVLFERFDSYKNSKIEDLYSNDDLKIETLDYKAKDYKVTYLKDNDTIVCDAVIVDDKLSQSEHYINNIYNLDNKENVNNLDNPNNSKKINKSIINNKLIDKNIKIMIDDFRFISSKEKIDSNLNKIIIYINDNQDKLDKEQVESYKSMAVTAAGKQYNYLHDFN